LNSLEDKSLEAKEISQAEMDIWGFMVQITACKCSSYIALEGVQQGTCHKVKCI